MKNFIMKLLINLHRKRIDQWWAWTYHEIGLAGRGDDMYPEPDFPKPKLPWYLRKVSEEAREYEKNRRINAFTQAMNDVLGECDGY